MSQTLHDPEEWASHAPEVRDIMRRSYFGRTAHRPDPGEPAQVLLEFLALNGHRETVDPGAADSVSVINASYSPASLLPELVAQSKPAGDGAQLQREITKWQRLVDQNPDSRHAHLGLAKLQEQRATEYRDASLLRDAATNYIAAVDAGLSNGLVRHVDDVARVLAAIQDQANLDNVFGRVLAAAPAIGPKEHYLALVFYADALSKLGRADAQNRFEEALAIAAPNTDLGVTWYAKYLLRRGNPLRALEILDDAGADMRLANEQPVLLRKEALTRLGADTSSADAEIELLRQRVQPGVEGAVPRPTVAGFQKPVGVHSTSNDDCRHPAYASTLLCPTGSGWCFYPYTVNLAEIIYNEAQGETRGAQAMVAWTVRNRGKQTLVVPGSSPPSICSTYPGGLAYYNAYRDTLPCGLTPAECVNARAYCWTEHGGTLQVGNSTVQYADWHVSLQTLYDSGALNRAFNMVNGWLPDESTGYIPSGVYSCTTTPCDRLCYGGQNSTSASSLGPMEFRSGYYQGQPAACLWPSQYVCGNGANPGDNYFWNRLY
jgi:hypothetical protein